MNNNESQAELFALENVDTPSVLVRKSLFEANFADVNNAVIFQ